MKKTITLLFLIVLYNWCFAQTWEQKANFAGAARFRSAVFSIGDTGYVVAGGGTSGYLSDAWEFDTLTNTWAQIANYPGSEDDATVGFSINGKGYVGTGAGAGY